MQHFVITINYSKQFPEIKLATLYGTNDLEAIEDFTADYCEDVFDLGGFPDIEAEVEKLKQSYIETRLVELLKSYTAEQRNALFLQASL